MSAEEAEDVQITGTSYTELRNPMVLAKHSSKEELVERRKIKFDLSNYSQLGVNELLSGYLSQVHAGRELEMGIVKQMHQKYEVQTSTSFVNIFLQPPSLSHRKRLIEDGKDFNQ